MKGAGYYDVDMLNWACYCVRCDDCMSKFRDRGGLSLEHYHEDLKWENF